MDKLQQNFEQSVNEENKVILRPAQVEDGAALLEIYRPYIERTAITFEYTVPTVGEFQGRIRQTLERYPYLVAEENGIIVGYAYLSTFKNRAAYDWSAETSIYLRMDCRRRGIGTRLYHGLEQAAGQMGLCNLNACVAAPPVEDEYLTMDSVRFHEYMGYSPVGTFHNCAYKFGRWYNMMWLEKMVGEHGEKMKKPWG